MKLNHFSEIIVYNKPSIPQIIAHNFLHLDFFQFPHKLIVNKVCTPQKH
ncbi:methionyl-tRNA formyltransferase [Listeria ivanovii FSL F6-596]|nr:methionyl-tRNA formyltransferase [Listeria ivanovii FSL F6-596]